MTGIRGRQRQEVTVSHPPAQRSIDPSLTRSIRCGYFKPLAREWGAYGQRRERAAGRNVFQSRPIDTRRQFHGQLGLLEKFVGPLLPACTSRVESGTRSAAVIWALHPEEVPASMLVDSHARIRALTLLQPGRYIGQEVAVRVRAHAIDRVVHRASVVDLPIWEDDMQAINADSPTCSPWPAWPASAWQSAPKRRRHRVSPWSPCRSCCRPNTAYCSEVGTPRPGSSGAEPSSTTRSSMPRRPRRCARSSVSTRTGCARSYCRYSCQVG